MKPYILYALATALVSSSLTGCNSDVNFLSDLHVDIPDGGVELVGSECNRLEWNGSKSQTGGVDIGEDGPYLQASTVIDKNSAKVTIKVKDETLHEKTYSESDLDDDEVDRVEHVGSDGLVYIWRFWGSDSCDFDLKKPD